MLVCPNKSSQEWRTLEAAVGTFEAFRDFLEYNGQIRTPDEVLAKQQLVIPFSDTVLKSVEDRQVEKLISISNKMELSKKAGLVKTLRNLGLISKRSFAQDNGFTFVSVPKITTEREYNRSLDQGVVVPRTKNFLAWNSLDEYLILLEDKGIDTDYITLHESKDAYYIKVPTEIYEASMRSSVMAFYRDMSSTIDLSKEFIPIDNLDQVSINSSISNQEAISLSESLSNQLGIDYQFISSDEASSLTIDSPNPWKGEKAFFVGSRVYFVGPDLSPNMVLHEFSHPLIRSLSVQNQPLFNNLFSNLISSNEGKNIVTEVRSLYPELDINSDLFKEEVIVRSLVKANNPQITDKGFRNFVKELFYAIKKLLRKIFGVKIDLSKLSPSTTINELSDMLVRGQNFELDKDSEAIDTVSYIRDQREYINDILKISKPELQALTTRVYDIATKHIEVVQNNKNYEEMLNILADEFNRGDLQEIRKNLTKYSGKLEARIKDIKDEVEYNRNHAIAMVNTLFRLDNMVTKIHAHMDDISTNPDNRDNLHKAFYYDYLLKYWYQFIQEAKEALDVEKVPSGSPISQLITKIDRNLEKSKKITQSIYSKGVKDILYEELTPIANNIKDKYDTIINNLKKRNAPQATIDLWYKEFHGLNESDNNKLKQLEKAQRENRLTADLRKEYDSLKRESFNGAELTPDKMEYALKGELGDANAFSSFFESYLYNPDPVVGGLALYVKNQMNEVLAKSQAKFNDFTKELGPLLKDAGYNPSNVSQLASKICHVQSVGTRDEEGNIVERKILTFMSPHKDYRMAIDNSKFEIDKSERAYSLSGSDEDKKNMIEKISDHKRLLRDYFHQEYQPEFYTREKLFERDDIGKEAAYLRENLFERMRNLTEPLITQQDELEISDQLDELWREYRQLHSRFDLNGQVKTGKDLEIAQRLREYREESRKFYEWKERQGVFQNALNSYEQELVDQGYEKGSTDFEALRNEWLKKNTRTVIKESFYTKRQMILDRISQILSKLPDSEKRKVDVSPLWSNILDMVSGFRDDDGQPNAQEMSQQSISEIKQTEEAIAVAQREFSSLNGLTRAEADELASYFDIVKSGERKLTQEELDRRNFLMNKKQVQGLSQLNKDELFKLFNDLQSIQRREATDYYIDIINNWLTKLDTDDVNKKLGSRIINKISADQFLDLSLIDSLLRQNEDFAKWFRENHILEEKWDPNVQDRVEKWRRLYVWSIIRPTDPTDLESTQIKDPDGEVVETILSKPSTKYYARVVKKKFKTEKVIGVTVDNKNQWLPRLDVKESPFINEDYNKLRSEQPALFKVLQKMTEHHLKNQEGLGYKSRLYLDVPRFRKNNLEVIQTQQLKRTIKGAVEGRLPLVTIMAKRIKLFWSKAKDNPESGFNYSDEFNLVRADMFDNEISSIPIAGLYDIDIDDVSSDITQSMMRYMLSAERQKKLVEINPIAQSLRSVVSDDKNQVKRLDAVNKFNFVNRGIVTYLSKKGKNVRKVAVDNFIEREFEGKTHTGMGGDVPWLNNTSTIIFKRASFGFFALNIPSAIKNSIGAKFQGMIEAAGGKYMNSATFAKGELWAFNTMGQVSFEIYKRGPKSLNIQLTEIFDPIQGRLEDKFGESMSRTMASDTTNLSWLYNFRKWTENQATLQAFAGMMYHQKVTQNGKEIPYIEAWELKDGKIQLKSGIDPDWGITYDEKGNIHIGSKFKMTKNRVQQVINNLNGAYSKFDQPEAQRYLAFRFISFLRRYFTTMAVNRWGFGGGIGHARGRLNPGLGDVSEGYYITVMKTISRAITTQGQYLGYMTNDERRAWIKFSTEMLSLLAISAIIIPFLGWDPDDEDKYEKLRARSGAMPFLGLVPEDKDHPFQGFGFLENHMLSLAMQVRSENEQFIPWPNFGLDDYSAMLDVKSLATGPTINAYKEMFTVGINQMTDDPSAYYLRDVGPYSWQKQDGSKFWNHTFKAIGLTGSTVDPVTAIKNFQGIQVRGK